MVQDQHHAIQIIAEKVTQLYKVAKEIRSLLSTTSAASRNEKKSTYNRPALALGRHSLKEEVSSEEEDSTKEKEDSTEEEEDSNPRMGSSKATNKPSKHGVKNGKHPASLRKGKIIKMSPKNTTPPHRYERQWASSPSSSRKRKHESESETEVEGNLQKKRKVKKELKL